MNRRTMLLFVSAVVFGSGIAARAADDDDCLYEGTVYSQGSQSCQQNALFRCSDGKWKATGSACSATSPKAAARGCQLYGISYPTGAASCQSGEQYRCEDGTWRSLGSVCPGDVTARVVPGKRTCMYEGATVASNSTICRSGTTFLCSDGEWANLGTLCR